MNQDNALQTLSLPVGASADEIKTAATQKKADIEEKMSAAPTDALKAKFQTMLDKVNEAEQVLSQPKTTKSRSPLSETKMADLPGAAPVGSTSVEHLQPGDTLSNGRYEIKEQIGEGGMGAVYRAYDTNREEDIAIKVLLPSLLKNEHARERFLNEAKISSKLSHPNIVNVYDVQHDNEQYFITMELLEGQDLRTSMETRKLVRQNFSEEEVKELLASIADGLSYAHKYTLHRDIKPENIWLTEDDEVKLMDFGIARLMSNSQMTQTGAAMGTAYYMAPEQLKGSKNIDGRADQYALAVLAYELLTGDVPAGVIEPINVARKDISKKLSQTIMQALSAKPEQRLENMKTFKEALLATGGVSMPSMPSIPKPSLPKMSKKNIGIAVSVMLLIGAGVGVKGYLEEQTAIKKAAISKEEQNARVETERKAKEAKALAEEERKTKERSELKRLAKLRNIKVPINIKTKLKDLCSITKPRHRIRYTTTFTSKSKVKHHFSRNNLSGTSWSYDDPDITFIILRSDGLIAMNSAVSGLTADVENKWSVQDNKLLLSYGNGYSKESYEWKTTKGILGKNNRGRYVCMQ